jgi:hypothetical protein
MPERTIKRRLQDCDAALASDDGPIFSTVAKLVEALRRSIPEGTQNAGAKKGALPRDRFDLTEPWSRETVLLRGQRPFPRARNPTRRTR